MKCELWNTYDIPMKSIEKIASLKNMRICTCIDKNYNVVVYIPQLNLITNNRYLSNLEGTGLTYRDACIVFIKNIMDNNFNVRYNNEFYVTELVRVQIMMMGIEFIYI